MPLIGIPFIISPDLLHALSSAGHGDEIVLADAHFPTSNLCKDGPKEIRADGHLIPPLLDAILKFFPLDEYVPYSVILMDRVGSDKLKSNLDPPIWQEYNEIIFKHDSKAKIEKIERFSFYERAKKSFFIVATGETAQYGNIILKKGIVKN